MPFLQEQFWRETLPCLASGDHLASGTSYSSQGLADLPSRSSSVQHTSSSTTDIDASNNILSFDQVLQGIGRNPGMKYTCPVCGKEFYNKADFRRHYMVHTGEKPFACPHCPHRAKQLAKIRYHINSNHPGLSQPP